MQNENISDKRIFARIPVSLPIRFLASDMNGECRGQTVDVSASGISFESKERLSPQTPVEMWLELPEGRGPFYTRGEVVWANGSTNENNRIGVHLEKAELVGLAPVLWRENRGR